MLIFDLSRLVLLSIAISWAGSSFFQSQSARRNPGAPGHFSVRPCSKTGVDDTKMKNKFYYAAVMFSGLLVMASGPGLYAQKTSKPEIKAAPGRKHGEGTGPFDRMVIRGVTVIDGTGGVPFGPVDVVVERDRITQVEIVGAPKVAMDEEKRPAKGTYEIDGKGMYLMPGFVDTHVHYGDAQKAPEAEYVNKLWLAHGVTTV